MNSVNQQDHMNTPLFHPHTAGNTPVVLSCHQLSRRFTQGGLDVSVLNGVDLQVHASQTLAVVGSSGSGKSTLLHLLGGLDRPTSGQVCVMGQDWQGLSLREQGLWRNQHVGFVYQFHHLLPELSALENVAMPLWIRRTPRQAALQAAHQVLVDVGLADRVQHRPAELSGGQRQRVAIARALVTQPACILADEPTGNLDVRTAAQVFDALHQATHQRGMALVLATHDLALAHQCQTQLSLLEGQLRPVEPGVPPGMALPA
jgi:lipoprotein-releasing system ATP-binding protein